MKEVKYVITDPLGIHARPAGLLVKEAAKCACKVTISVGGGAAVDAKRIMGVMRLAVKQSMEITMAFDGPDEDAAADALEAFLKANL